MGPSPTLTDTNANSLGPPLPSEHNMKRKLDDAMQILDDAVFTPSDETGRPSVPKKSRSIYSTLVKYGIKTKDSKPTAGQSRLESLSKSAPHLAAILARAKSRSSRSIDSTIALTVAPPSTSEYRPSSTSCFLSRLSTYRLATYTNKPPQIDAVAAAKCGWINDGRDRLACGVCKASWVVAPTYGMNREAANSLVEKQRVQLVSAHKDGCPWKTQQCDASVYRLPVQSPAATAKEVKARALDLEPILDDVNIKHPLSSTQIQLLMSALSTFNVARPRSASAASAEESSSPSSPSDGFFSQAEPSVTAALISLFGWNLPPLPSAEQAAPSRPSSFVSSIAGPTSSRASSVTSFHDTERSNTPQPWIPITSRRDSKQHRDTSLLYCRMCQRRVGLWAFGPGAANRGDCPRRQFDLLKEHRPYCPYVVRSTIVPSLPMPSGYSAVLNGASISTDTPGSSTPSGPDAPVEGWRAILSVILKCRKRLITTRGGSDGTPTGGRVSLAPEEGMEVDRVEALVDGVKRRGGKELLKYVKGLLS